MFGSPRQAWRWLLALALFPLLLLATPARAQTLTPGVDFDGSQATLWLRSSSGLAWVDAHYRVDNGAQQNVRMAWNSGAGRFETRFAASAGQVVTHFFTTNSGSVSTDSPTGSSTVGGGSPPPPPPPPPAGISQGSEAASGGALIWLAGSGVQWADIHYTVDNGAQQNVRMVYSSARARHELSLSAAAGSVVRYSFTYYVNAASDSASYQLTVGGLPPSAASPQFSVPGGSYAGPQSVQLSSSTPGASIRYTLDGSTPSSSSTPYSGPITVSGSLTLKAIAIASGYSPSAVVQASYVIGGGSSGFTQGAQDASGGALIWFSGAADLSWVDLHVNAGSGQQNLRMNWNAAAARYESAIAAAAGATLSYSFTYYRSSVGAADSSGYTYRVGGGNACNGTVAAPAFSPVGGSYASAQSVQLSSSTLNAEIRYTLDGSTPTASSPLYGSALTLASSATVKAIALKSCMQASAVSSASYAIGGDTLSFTRGVSELGASATVWFKPSAAMQFVILHYGLAGQPDINPAMSYNAAIGRYEFVLSPVAAGQTLNYGFTYQAVGGAQTDSPRYSLVLGGGVAGPSFSPASGSYAGPQAVSLANAAGVSGSIRYTTDGTAPTQLSPLYAGPITVDHASTIYATTFTTDGQSRTSMGNYVIGGGSGAVAMPQFSPPGGSASTRLRVNLLSETAGAAIRYTTDGSTPTLDSLPYGGPIEVNATQTLKAVAFKAGVASSVATAAYNLTGTGSSDSLWNGQTTFNIANATRGRWSDSQVYWAIIGKDWASGQFVHVGPQGQLIPMSLGDNGALTKYGLPYSNYFFRLDQQRSVTIPPINSARILFSVGGPMYIAVNIDGNGKVAYAGANIENPTDPNTDVIFDFGEFAILPPGANPQGIFINTTRVDQFGFPLRLEVSGLDGFRQTVGEPLSETREELFAKFFAETPAEFHSLGQPPYGPYRIMAPAHATFQTGGANVGYLDAYIDSVWTQYIGQDLVLDLKNGWAPFTGRVVGGKLRFTDAGGGQYFINGKPTTSMVMLGNGLLDDTSGGPSDAGKQLQLQAQVCAALNRQVAHLAGSEWWNGNRFFPAGRPANAFAKFWHDHSLNALAYGFAYDDVGGFSPSIHTRAPQTVTYTIGW